jgi:hypothetical protein
VANSERSTLLTSLCAGFIWPIVLESLHFDVSVIESNIAQVRGRAT